MQLVDNDEFLKRLAELFEPAENRGPIWLTHKRLTHDGEDTTMKSNEVENDTQEYPCLIRVTHAGKNRVKVKFSTQVLSSELDKFHTAYGSLLKASMTPGLRKRDKKKEKTRSEKAAERKRKMTEPIPIEGPKRGNGRRKRQRRIKAIIKQQESQLKFQQREAAKGQAKSA